MLRFPAKVSAQQQILAPLEALVARVPACELYIIFTENVDAKMDALSVAAFQNISSIAQSMHKVFDYLQMQGTPSIPLSNYLLTLSKSAYLLFLNAAIMAQTNVSGDINVQITADAQTALATLVAWDPTMGYQAPSNPGAVATRLMRGVSV